MNYTKKLIVLICTLCLNASLFAGIVEVKELNFPLDTASLYKGDIFYSLAIMKPKELKSKFPELATLDTISFSKQKNIRLVVTKSAYVVKKPAGMFDHETIGGEKFVQHYLGDQKAKRMGEQDFMVTVPSGYSYRMKTYFDSDDISTLPNSKVIRAVTETKKLDVISQSSTFVIFREFTDFSKYSIAGAEVSSIIPLKENKTLIITYSLTAVKKYYAIEKVLKSSFQKDVEAQRNLINRFD